MTAGAQWKNPKWKINGHRHPFKFGMNRTRNRQLFIDDLYFVIPESKMRVIVVTGRHHTVLSVHRSGADLLNIVTLYKHPTALRECILRYSFLGFEIKFYGVTLKRAFCLFEICSLNNISQAIETVIRS